jgi:hypothetical protein
MSQGQLRVDPGQIGRAGAGITAAARQIQSHLQEFGAELGGFGQVFGSDAVSAAIGGCYEAIAQAAMTSFADNVRALGGHGERVRIMGAGYLRAEDVSAIEVNRVREILG